MIKTILWDFDGVILDSMQIKCDGFLELFKKSDEDSLKKLSKFHFENGGVSRFEKIKYFYQNILKKNIDEADVLIMAEEFGSIIQKRINNKDNLIKDSMYFIRENYANYSFHIVSGAEHKELNYICNQLEVEKYFITINGSPIKKDILVKKLLKKYNYKPEQTILIGDAMTDYNAAKRNNIKFYGYNNIDLKKYNYINNFRDFHI